MSTEHLPLRLPGGNRLQSGIPSRPVPNQPGRAMGLNLTGAVTATYVMDDPHHFHNDGRAGEVGAISVYCDVLCYTNISGMRWRFLPRCRVRQDRGGIHSGRVWKPRASTMDVTGEALDLDKGSNPANFDGDHVMVSFLNDQLNEPIIVGGIPHPSVDTGNDGSTERQRIQLREADGDPDFWKHHGAKYGVESNGDFVVDTRFSHDGAFTDAGKEKDPPTDGTGAQRLNLPLDAEFRVSFQDMTDPVNPTEKATLTITKEKFHLVFVDSGFELLIDDSNTVIHLGGDGENAVIESLVRPEFQKLVDKINEVKWLLGAHRHPLPEYPFPLMFADMIECFAQPAVYIVKGQAPINLRTQAEVKPGSAMMDLDAGLGEYFGVDSGPSPADLIDNQEDASDTSSDTVKIKS